MPTQGTRQKRWASRARTGCQTCRIRRIKCDEGRPVCNKCAAGRRACHYVLDAQRPGEAAERQKGRTLLPLLKTEPPDWDLTQSVRYYFVAVRPHRVGEFEDVIDPPFISKATGAHGRLLRPGEDTAASGLWASYSRYMNKHLALINKIVGGKLVPSKLAIGPLMDLMSFDLLAPGIFWQLHMNGLFAYIENIGGIKFILGLPKLPHRFASLMHRSITSNTTSPSTGQVTGHHYYTDKQLKKVLDSDISSDMPCPTELYIVLAHTSIIRHRAASDRLEKPQEFHAMVRQVFSDLNNFGPVSWAKESEFLCKEIAPLIGQIFHAAVCLFCTLTMPRRAVLAAYASEATSYQALRASQRRDLLGLIKEGLSKVGFANSISWPIIVVGVASGTAHDEAQGDPDYQEALETQAFVEEQLFAAWMHPIAHVANYLLLEKLRLFWRSGKVEWDDCFYEASAC